MQQVAHHTGSLSGKPSLYSGYYTTQKARGGSDRCFIPPLLEFTLKATLNKFKPRSNSPRPNALASKSTSTLSAAPQALLPFKPSGAKSRPKRPCSFRPDKMVAFKSRGLNLPAPYCESESTSFNATTKYPSSSTWSSPASSPYSPSFAPRVFSSPSGDRSPRTKPKLSRLAIPDRNPALPPRYMKKTSNSSRSGSRRVMELSRSTCAESRPLKVFQVDVKPLNVVPRKSLDGQS